MAKTTMTIPAEPAAWPKQKLRPSRLPLLWVVPLLVTYIVIAAVQTTKWFPHILGYGLFLLFIGPVGLSYCVLMITGGVDIRADGFRVRNGLKAITIPWNDVDGFKVYTTLFGKGVRVSLKKGSAAKKSQLKLPAPRQTLRAGSATFNRELELLATAAGSRQNRRFAPSTEALRSVRIILGLLLCLLLAISVATDKPWLDPWWPGRHQASELPSACAVAWSGAAQLAPGARRLHDHTDAAESSECYLANRDSRLELNYQLVQRSFGAAAPQEAHSSILANAPGLLGSTPVQLAGIGDEAFRGESSGHVHIVARKANVIVDLSYSTDQRDGANQEAVIGLVRNAIAAIGL